MATETIGQRAAAFTQRDAARIARVVRKVERAPQPRMALDPRGAYGIDLQLRVGKLKSALVASSTTPVEVDEWWLNYPTGWETKNAETFWVIDRFAWAADAGKWCAAIPITYDAANSKRVHLVIAVEC